MWMRLGAAVVCAGMLVGCADDQMNGNGDATPAAARQGDVSKSDQEWVKTAASAGMFEVQSSQLALQRAMNDTQTRQFAQRMITDHTQANQELMALASRKNIPMQSTMMDRHQKMMDKLRDADGESFLTEYHSAQRMAHDEAVSHFENGEKELQDAELKAFATKTLPVLKDHMEMLKEHGH